MLSRQAGMSRIEGDEHGWVGGPLHAKWATTTEACSWAGSLLRSCGASPLFKPSVLCVPCSCHAESTSKEPAHRVEQGQQACRVARQVEQVGGLARQAKKAGLVVQQRLDAAGQAGQAHLQQD